MVTIHLKTRWLSVLRLHLVPRACRRTVGCSTGGTPRRVFVRIAGRLGRVPIASFGSDSGSGSSGASASSKGELLVSIAVRATRLVDGTPLNGEARLALRVERGERSGARSTILEIEELGIRDLALC